MSVMIMSARVYYNLQKRVTHTPPRTHTHTHTHEFFCTQESGESADGLVHISKTHGSMESELGAKMDAERALVLQGSMYLCVVYTWA